MNPFGAKDVVSIIRHQLATPTPPMKTVAPGVRVPAALEAVVMRLTEKQPEKRYASAAELLVALKEVAAQEGLPPEPSSPPTAPPSAPPAAPTSTAPTAASAEVLSVSGTQMDPPTAPLQPRAAALEPPPPPPPTIPPRPSASATEARSLLTELSARLPDPLRHRPLLLLLTLPVLVVVLVVLLRPGKRPEPATHQARPAAAPSAGRARAPKDQLKQASTAGLQAVLELSERYPQDPRVQRAVAHSYMAKEDGVQALRWLARAAALESDLVVDGEIAQAVTQAADQGADALEAAVGLLEGPFGARGVDVLYRLAFRPSPARLKGRAKQSLERPEVRAHATPAAAIALELHAAPSCADKRALLTRAAKVGDHRTLQQLSALTQTRSCGPYGLIDCWSCLREDSALRDTIATLDARLK